MKTARTILVANLKETLYNKYGMSYKTTHRKPRNIMGKTKQNKTLLLAVAVLVIAMAAFFMVHAVFAPTAAEGAKAVTIEVIDNEEASTSYELHTDALYLRQALEEAEGLTFSGTEGSYGLMIETVNDCTADWDKDHAWWSVYVNGELANYGVDQQPVNDGDVFRLQYTTEANA